MSDIRLEPVEDWSTVKVGDPVRLTKGTLQINGVAQEVALNGGWLVLQDAEKNSGVFGKRHGWVLERPVILDAGEVTRNAILTDVLGTFDEFERDGNPVTLEQLRNAVALTIAKAGR